LDWELHKAGVQFVRYADDFLVFAKDEKGVKHGEIIVQGVMRSLKLDLSAEKTKTLYLMEERTANGRTIPELEYLGVAIQGWFRKRDGSWSFGLKCTPDAVRAFRAAIKERTPKTHTLSLDALVKRVNPVILGKAAYWAQAAKAVQVYKSIRGQCRCSTALLSQQVTKLDTYVRQRIRRCRLPQRGGSKTYRRTNMLSSIYTHERLIGAGLRYAEKITRDAATGVSLPDDQYLAIVRQRREKAASAKRQYKAGDTVYWAKRAAAYERAQERIRKFESK